MNIKIIDLSGYSFTGKAAFTDLLSEFKGFHVHQKDFEFDLLRIPNGIIDLSIALTDEWSPVRSSEVIRGFKQIIKAYGGRKRILDKLTTSGRHYNAVFPNFVSTSNKYIESLIDSSWVGLWPYAIDKTPLIRMCLYKILYKLGYKLIFEKEIYLSAPSKEEFIAKTKKYLTLILTSNIDPGDSTVVTNNAFEPFNPSKSMQFFDNCKSIVIDRNPIDIYLSACNYKNKDGSNGWKPTLGKNVEDFVKRFKLYRKKNNNKNSEKILRVNFEDLVLDYENTVNLILNFLDEDNSIHVFKKKLFDPEISKINVGMPIQSNRKAEVEYIRKELKQYCHIC